MAANDQMKQKGLLQQQIREFLDSERGVYFERRRQAIEPLQAQQRAWIGHAVSYAQLALRAAFILNGGAIIAVPAFAEFFGDGLWAKGAVWPLFALSAFLFGLILCGCATACAFFAMTNYSKQTNEVMGRAAGQTEHDFRRALSGEQKSSTVDFGKETTEEQKFREAGASWEQGGIILGVLAFVAFVLGAGAAVYILSGAPVSEL